MGEGDETDYKEVGLVGVINLTVLMGIVVWRTHRCMAMFEGGKDPVASWEKFKKKMVFHILLGLATIIDFPCYISFLATGGYQPETYAFHRLQGMFICLALSMTIVDWSDFLLSIDELEPRFVQRRKGLVVLINVMNIVISLSSCFVCLAQRNHFHKFTHSTLYEADVIIQMVSATVLIGLMLQAGLKLSWRLAAVANPANTNNVIEQHSELDFEQKGIDSDDETDLDVNDDALYSPTTLSYQQRGESESKDSIDGDDSLALKYDARSYDTRSYTKSKQRSHEGRRSHTTSSSSSMNPVGGAWLSRDSSTGGHDDEEDEEEDGMKGRENHNGMFRTYLFKINFVVTILLLSTLLGSGFLLATLIVGNAEDQNAFFGPVLVDFTFHFWLPLWGPVLAMLFLARSSTHLHSKIQRNQGESGVEVDGGPDTEGHGRSLKMDKDLESLKVTTGDRGRDRGPSWLRWLTRITIEHDAKRGDGDGGDVSTLHGDHAGRSPLSEPLLGESPSPVHTPFPAHTSAGAASGEGPGGSRGGGYAPSRPPDLRAKSEHSPSDVVDARRGGASGRVSEGGESGRGGDASFDTGALDMSLAGKDPALHFSASLRRPSRVMDTEPVDALTSSVDAGANVNASHDGVQDSFVRD